MTTPYRQCWSCKHLIEGTATCKAFPDGIPDEIWTNEVDHTTPYPGDNNTQFENNLEK